MISACYFLGITIGSYYSQSTIVRVGYIRAFVIFASLMAISALMLGLTDSIHSWMLSRFINGYALAALFLIIESWCLLSTDKSQRGIVFSVYLFIYYGSQS